MSALGHCDWEGQRRPRANIVCTRGANLLPRSLHTGNKRRSCQPSNHAAHEIHLVAVGSAFRRLGSISPPHWEQIP